MKSQGILLRLFQRKLDVKQKYLYKDTYFQKQDRKLFTKLLNNTPNKLSKFRTHWECVTPITELNLRLRC